METPYITRSQNPLPKEGSQKKPELFNPSSEQAKRSILIGLSTDMESNNPKDNLRALGTIQNLDVLQTKDGKSTGFENISAPIPGLDADRNLKGMIEDGLVKPSDSMKEMAERHGLEIPSQLPNGPDPFRPENGPEMLKAEAPSSEPGNPGIRNLTTNLADQVQGPTSETAEANKKTLDAFNSITSVFEQLEPTKEGPQEPQKEAMPWDKAEPAKPEKETNPTELFNQAAEALAKLDPKSQKDVLENIFLKSTEKSVQQFQEKNPLNDIIKDPIGALLDPKQNPLLQIFDSTGIIKKEAELAKKLWDGGVNPIAMIQDPIGTIGKGLKILVGGLEEDRKKEPKGEKDQELDEQEQPGKKNTSIEDINKSLKKLSKMSIDEINENITKEGDKAKANITDFIKDPIGSLLKPFKELAGRSAEKEPNSKEQEGQATKKETPEKGTSAISKKMDTFTTKSTPAVKGIKAGIELFQEAASNKSLPDKMAGMTKAAGKAIVSIAQGVGTKVAAGALATPVAPLAAVLMVTAMAAKLGKESLMGAMLPNQGQSQDKPQDASQTQPQGQSQDKPQDSDKKDVLEDAINTIMPAAGGKKGLAVKGVVKAGKTATTAVKDDLSGEKAQQEEKKQQSQAPEVTM